MKRIVFGVIWCLLLMSILSFGGFKGKESVHEVVIYTSLDKVFSQPVFKAFCTFCNPSLR